MTSVFNDIKGSLKSKTLFQGSPGLIVSITLSNLSAGLKIYPKFCENFGIFVESILILDFNS
jgi:hypothetical protein